MTIELAENDIRDAFKDITFEAPVSRIIAGARRRQHRRRISIAAIPAMGLVAAGGALLSSDDLQIAHVACYDSGPNDPNRGVVAPRSSGVFPESVCAEMWARGGLPLGKGGTRGVVPPLTACVITQDATGMKRGNVGVFPTDEEDFCSTPGLQPLPEGYLDRVIPFAEMMEDAGLTLRAAAVSEGGSEAHACLTSDSAVRVVTEVLKKHGYDDWTVRVGDDRGGPCWTDVWFDPQELEALITSTSDGTKVITINGGRTVYPEDW